MYIHKVMDYIVNGFSKTDFQFLDSKRNEVSVLKRKNLIHTKI